jgi:hypothetical protein
MQGRAHRLGPSTVQSYYAARPSSSPPGGWEWRGFEADVERGLPAELSRCPSRCAQDEIRAPDRVAATERRQTRRVTDGVRAATPYRSGDSLERKLGMPTPSDPGHARVGGTGVPRAWRRACRLAPHSGREPTDGSLGFGPTGRVGRRARRCLRHERCDACPEPADGTSPPAPLNGELHEDFDLGCTARPPRAAACSPPFGPPSRGECPSASPRDAS